MMRHDLEAVVLTGGLSRRMGQDKSKLVVDGASLADRIVDKLEMCCDRITVLGPEPVRAWPNLKDPAPGEGPLVALARISPQREYCFIAACDMPGFDGEIVHALLDWIGEKQAAVPVLDGRVQPLCAVYRREAWTQLASLVGGGERRIMAWLERLDVAFVGEEELDVAGVAPDSIRGVNTPSEWAAFRRPTRPNGTA